MSTSLAMASIINSLIYLKTYKKKI